MAALGAKFEQEVCALNQVLLCVLTAVLSGQVARLASEEAPSSLLDVQTAAGVETTGYIFLCNNLTIVESTLKLV